LKYASKRSDPIDIISDSEGTGRAGCGVHCMAMLRD